MAMLVSERMLHVTVRPAQVWKKLRAVQSVCGVPTCRPPPVLFAMSALC